MRERKGRRGEREDPKRRGRQEGCDMFAEYKNNFDSAIVSPAYISVHLIYPAKQVSLLVCNDVADFHCSDSCNKNKGKFQRNLGCR